jgi:hypothetical protein
LVPRSHCAVGHSLGYVVFLPRAALATVRSQCNLSSSLALHQSVAQHNLACRPRPTGSSRGLRFPSARNKLGSPLGTGVAGARYVPPSGFGYPLGGLLLPSPCRLCFTPAALLGFALRSFLLSEGIRTFPGGWTHVPFSLPLFRPRIASGQAGPADLGFWAFTLSRVPGDRRRVSTASAGCSLGLRPFRACGRKSCAGLSPEAPPTRFSQTRALQRSRNGAPESHQLPLDFVRPPANRRPHKAALLGFSHLALPGI